MELYPTSQNYTLYQETAKQPYYLQLSDKDTNEDSDQEKNHYWETQNLYDLASQRDPAQSGNKKLKNQLCRNFIKNGFCNYGFKCQFAHGVEELKKNKNQNSKYKTKECTSYFNEGVCMYGVRCNFRHHKQDDVKTRGKGRIRLSVLYANHPELAIADRPRLRLFQSFDQKY